MAETFLGFFANNKDAFVALGVLIAAGVSVFGAWWTTRATRINNISQMRERWIENIREDIAELLSILAKEHIEIFDDSQDYTEIMKEYMREKNKIINKIRLRLNLEDESHALLLELMTKIIRSENTLEFGDLQKEIVKSSRNIIQTEWKRVSN